MFENIKIGFIGFGNMAQAMADGFILKDSVKRENIYASAKNWNKLCKNTEARGINPCSTSYEVAENSDIVVIAVKPYMVDTVIEPIKEILKGKIVVSVAAGCLFDKYENILLPGTAHISTIPSVPVSVGEGIIIAESRHSLSESQYETVKGLFSDIGLFQPVESSQLSIAGTLSGCGPAFAAMFIEALSDAAVKHGLARDVSYKLASQMIMGTGKLQIETGKHPGQIKDSVCSPGGTTIVGVAALERNGFRNAVIEALDDIENK